MVSFYTRFTEFNPINPMKMCSYFLIKGYPNASIGLVNDIPETKDEIHEGMEKYFVHELQCSCEK